MPSGTSRDTAAAGAPAGFKAPRKQQATQPAAPGSGGGTGTTGTAIPVQMLARARACFGPDWPAPRKAMQAGAAFLNEALWGRPPTPPFPSLASGCSSDPGGGASSFNGSGSSGSGSSTTAAGAAEGAGSGSSSGSGGSGSRPLQRHGRRRVVIVPDKDVDGLAAGAVLLRTLSALIREAQQQRRPGAADVEVEVVHIGKGENVFQPQVAARLAAAAPTALVLLDMGSRAGRSSGPGPVLRLPLPPVDPASPASEQPRGKEDEMPAGGSAAHDGAVSAAAVAVANAAAVCAASGGGGGLAVPTLLIDHHKPEGFPEGAVAVSAFGCTPVATSALLTWCVCAQLHPPLAAPNAWLAVLGTLGDLGEEGMGAFSGAGGGAAAGAASSAAGGADGGTSSDDGVAQGAAGGVSSGASSGAAAAAGRAALPELDAVYRAGRKTHFKDAVALLNAARRSPACDVAGAWATLCAAQQPADISKGDVPGAAALRAARAGLKDEMDRLAATPPRFSSDGALALLAVDSDWKVHPLLPQRWAYRLGSQDHRGRMRAVMCANRGYMPGRVHFSIRRVAGPGGAGVDLISQLQGLVAQRCALVALADTPLAGLGGRLGADFARDHPEATGGMLAAEDFAQLMLLAGFTADVAYGAAGIAVGPEQQQLAGAAAAALQSLEQAGQGDAGASASGGPACTPGAHSGGKKMTCGGGRSSAGGASDAKQRKLTDFMPARPNQAAAPDVS
ncbi:hypothetical protein HXX76_007185 [Chlamydomonas incerta]|uniref:Uncharacterized protein n=1 Tax=Chlamydomonas incerta TaxID=51695 RepID=A0A835SXQ4_CHLIN|nr:hypothetical protein HXX76_007185 [Chlamydomonas incerta]|eukprot:KAG2435099.1 hypothetical protein HXX76_007185 [Chlamydomonas incerta]